MSERNTFRGHSVLQRCEMRVMQQSMHLEMQAREYVCPPRHNQVYLHPTTSMHIYQSEAVVLGFIEDEVVTEV